MRARPSAHVMQLQWEWRVVVMRARYPWPRPFHFTWTWLPGVQVAMNAPHLWSLWRDLNLHVHFFVQGDDPIRTNLHLRACSTPWWLASSSCLDISAAGRGIAKHVYMYPILVQSCTLSWCTPYLIFVTSSHSYPSSWPSFSSFLQRSVPVRVLSDARVEICVIHVDPPLVLALFEGVPMEGTKWF